MKELMLCLNIRDIAVIIDYCCIIHNISKSKAIYLLKIMCLMIKSIYKMHVKKTILKIESATIDGDKFYLQLILEKALYGR